MNNWEKAKKDLGLDISFSNELKVEDDLLHIEIILKNFGAPKGMIIVREYNKIKNYVDALNQNGWGYSALSLGNKYDRESFIEMLSDWGWTGPENEKPNWLLENNNE